MILNKLGLSPKEVWKRLYYAKEEDIATSEVTRLLTQHR